MEVSRLLRRCQGRRFAHLVAILTVALSLTGMTSTAADAAADKDGFSVIFNGTSLDGWEGKPEFWSVADGAIVGQTTAEKPTKGNTFLIWKRGTVGDFELKLFYRITGGNSGIQYRSKDHGDFVVGGYQADFEAGPTYSGIVYEERGRGILANRGERMTIAADGKKAAGAPIGNTGDLQKAIKPGEWNEYTVVARGPRLQHFINGQLMSELIDEQDGKRATEGVLALQLHAGPPMKVEFKEIRIKNKPAQAAGK